MHNMRLQPLITVAAALTMIAFYGTAAFASETYELVAEWGSYGSEEGQFIEAQGIAVGPDGTGLHFVTCDPDDIHELFSR